MQPGGIQSGFGAGAQAQTQRQQWKLYARFAEGIAKRAGASQEHATPTDVFARQVVDAVLANNPRPVIRAGAGSGALPRLARLPVAIKDRLLMKQFGLS